MGSAGARTGLWVTDPGNLADQPFCSRGDSITPAQRAFVPREQHPYMPDTVYAVGKMGVDLGF